MPVGFQKLGIDLTEKDRLRLEVMNKKYYDTHRGKKILSFEEKTYVCDLGFFSY